LTLVKQFPPPPAHAAAEQEKPIMEQQHPRPSFWKAPFGIGATIAAAIASIYLWVAHKDHVLALLPFVFLAACPLMHMFMHRGHGHGGHAHGARPDSDDARRD
jgi:hypothetical protein